MIPANIDYDILDNYMGSGQGRALVASSMVQPLRDKRDYASFARRAFLVENLKNGVLPTCEKDIDAKAYIVGEEGDSISVIVKGKRVLFPMFELTAYPQVPITEITNRRYDILRRTVEKHVSEIGYQEDVKAFSCIDALMDDPAAFNQDITVAGALTPSVLSDAFANIEDNRLKVAFVFMNAKDHADIRKWDRDIFDPISQAELLKTGARAGIWDAKIVVSDVIPKGTVYLTCEPEFFGRFPIRYDLTIVSADSPEHRTVGYSMFECIGIGAYNSKGCQRIRIVR